jgi:hypothetical protein
MLSPGNTPHRIILTSFLQIGFAGRFANADYVTSLHIPFSSVKGQALISSVLRY